MSTITHRTDRKTGLPVATIRLAPGERAVILKPGQAALVIEDDAHYRLGGQVDIIVGAHVLQESERVCWDSIDQAWLATGHHILKTGEGA